MKRKPHRAKAKSEKPKPSGEIRMIDWSKLAPLRGKFHPNVGPFDVELFRE